jgi:hypothetical protein
MIDLNKIAKNFLNIVILILLFIILLKSCKNNPTSTSSLKIIRDTVWIIKDSIVNTKPQLITSIPYPITNYSKEYLPDTNYIKLVKQYQSIVAQLLATNIYKDSIKVDSIGNIFITDSVSMNALMGRSVAYNFKYPKIKETIIVPEKKRNQCYIGFSLQGNQYVPVDIMSAEFLFKNKKDNIYGVSAGITSDAKFIYGIRSFWKIKFR